MVTDLYVMHSFEKKKKNLKQKYESFTQMKTALGTWIAVGNCSCYG